MFNFPSFTILYIYRQFQETLSLSVADALSNFCVGLIIASLKFLIIDWTMKLKYDLFVYERK